MVKTNEDRVVIYQANDGAPVIEVSFAHDTVWLSQAQMVELFEKTKQNISLHINNIFKEGELDKASVVKDSLTTAADSKQYKTKLYNLDVIISVGYRVKSQRGTQFRIWAADVIKRYLIDGYALNERKLQAQHEHLNNLKQAISLTSRLVHQETLSSKDTRSIISILEQYSHALSVLDDYDHQRLQIADTRISAQTPIAYHEAMKQIALWREKEKLSALFGNEKDDSFHSSLNTIYQVFNGEELYPSIEEKAANLLYFIVKNHSFSDGNKRIAAAIFAWFLECNQYLYRENGEKRIADNALVALTLLIAESNPAEKDTIVKVVISLINGKNG